MERLRQTVKPRLLGLGASQPDGVFGAKGGFPLEKVPWSGKSLV